VVTIIRHLIKIIAMKKLVAIYLHDVVVNYNRRFVCQLPPSFRVFNPAGTDDIDTLAPGKRRADPGEEVPGEPKKPKRDGDARERSEYIENRHQIEEFKMRESENWKTDYCGKCIDDRPAWKGKGKMCPRWHIKGDCFEDCAHAASHVSDDEVSEEKREEFRYYLEKVRND